MTTRRAKARSMSFSQLPDELLMLVFQHLGFIDKLRVGRVCAKWRRVSRDGTLWRVIDISGHHVVSRTIMRMLKRCASDYTKVLRIRSYPILERPKSHNSNPITANAWDTILRSCSNLEELYIEDTDLKFLSNIWLLPSTMRRMYFINCYNVSDKRSVHNLFKNSKRHPALELIVSESTSHLLTNVLDLRMLSKCKTIKHLAICATSKFNEFLQGIDLPYLCPMTQLTHLDLHDCMIGLSTDYFKTLVHSLYNLVALDISHANISSLTTANLNTVWADIWRLAVPNLALLKMCLVVVRNIQQDECKTWYQLKSPFKERFGLRVIGCKLRNPDDHNCELESIIPAPTTHLSSWSGPKATDT